MYRIYIAYFLLLTCCICSCSTDDSLVSTPVLTKEQQLQQNLATLKTTARSGDLLVRLTDDILSQQVTNMNEKEKLYSHGGLIVKKGDRLFVYHIAPNLPGTDTIQMEPIDSFIAPNKNIRCALFRYQLSDAERDSLMQIIASLRTKDIRFDMVYDLATNDKLYCSEMIAKSLKQATGGRIVCREIPVPGRMYRLLSVFFQKYKNAKRIIAERTFISLDNLYLRPDCKELMRFDLKIFPGQ